MKKYKYSLCFIKRKRSKFFVCYDLFVMYKGKKIEKIGVYFKIFKHDYCCRVNFARLKFWYVRGIFLSKRASFILHGLGNMSMF